MANEYLYGAYGHIGETVAQSAVQAGTTPVYIGTAPVNLVRGFADAGVINEPIKLSNMIDAQRKLGYAADWGTFTLCEVMNAHFNNTLGNIGPIYVINVLDPSAGKHRKATETTQQLSFTGGRAEFASSTIILDTLTIAKSDGGDYAEGTDYAVDYNFTKGTVIITSLNADSPLTGTLTASFYEVDDSTIEDDDIIGGVTAGGEYSGLSSIALLYPEQFAVCNLIAAPGWSHSPAVYNAMLAASQKINGHWDAFVYADIPLVNGGAKAGMAKVGESRIGPGEKVDTIETAKTWQLDNGYTNERSKVFWPQMQDTAGRIYHISALAAWSSMTVDATHDDIPMESPSNKPIPVARQYFGEGSTNRGFDQQRANELNAVGITTGVYWGGQWVLWGPHTAAYKYGSVADLRSIFDNTIRMMMYVTNSFQSEHALQIDKPMTRAMADTIKNREQEKADAWAVLGAFIGKPVVDFRETDNSTAELAEGNFVWRFEGTPTPPFKSGTLKVAYSSEGFDSYFGEATE